MIDGQSISEELQGETTRAMDIKIGFYFSDSWIRYRTWSDMEVSVHDGKVWRGSIFIYIRTMYYIFSLSDSTSGFHYRSWITKRCYFGLYVFCPGYKLASHRSHRYDCLFFIIIFLQCCWWLDLPLVRSNSGRRINRVF